MKIVIVDDSTADRALCGRLLTEVYGSRLKYLEAGNAGAGLNMCRAERPDCVLVDYKLPDMTGIEFLAKLVAEEPNAAVVMLTGLDCGEIAAAALKAGAHDFLPKDHITGETLLLAIEKSIQRLNLTRMLHAERDRLAMSLAEKEVLLKEIHHRVKNNLQVISSLLRLQAANIKDDISARALLQSQHRVESMALVHEQLYESEDFREVDMARHAAKLVANLCESYGVDPGRIATHVTVDCVPLTVDQAIPVSLILTELVSNALSHGFPEGRSGAVRVEFHRAAGRIRLDVADDGVGVPEGMEPRRGRSLGLSIVNILAKQLKGEFSWERGSRGAGPGTTFSVSFPERQPAGESVSIAAAPGS